MKWLTLLLLAQNMNVTPIESRQAGARLSTQRQYVVDCRTGMTCATDGGVLYLSSSGGTGGSGAPVDGGFVTFGGGTTGSTNERTLTAGTNVTIDLTTPGQVILNASGGGGSSGPLPSFGGF